MAEDAEPSGAAQATAPRIRVMCRQDPATGARILDIEPPLADGHVFDEDWLRLQPGDTLRLTLIVGGA